MKHASVRVHAAAFLVALLQAGLVTEAYSFVEWCVETLDLELEETLTENLEQDA
ncbi:MAG: hypothetical protein ACREJC_22485 [Tepidisphaeraceae bacterium]